MAILNIPLTMLGVTHVAFELFSLLLLLHAHPPPQLVFSEAAVDADEGNGSCGAITFNSASVRLLHAKRTKY